MATPDWSEGFPVEVGAYVLGLAEASPETAGYWEGVARNALLLKRCPRCRAFLHPRRMVCSACGTVPLEWRQASGRGTIYTYSAVHRAPRPEFKDSIPYYVGIVALEEEVHLFTRFFAREPGRIRIGAAVSVEFRQLETGEKLPVFFVAESP